MQGPQHDDPSRDARQVPCRVIPCLGERGLVLSSEPCTKAACRPAAIIHLQLFAASAHLAAMSAQVPRLNVAPRQPPCAPALQATGAGPL